MRESLSQLYETNTSEKRQELGRITVLEALAEDSVAISVNRSNMSTRYDQSSDPDDQ